MTVAEPAAFPVEHRTAERRLEASASPLVRNSLIGSAWTLISRITGLVRVVVIGAVLGATYLGNTYQAINALPNLVYYQLLAGSLFVSLVVPPLVAHIREGDRERANRFVGGFLGSMGAIAAAAVILLIAVGPLILRLLSLGVADGETAAAQRRIGLLFIVLFAPQIILYVIAGTGAAVMNAYDRYALASGAPTLENIGIILTLGLAALLFSPGVRISSVSTGEALLLGLGTTGAVAAHAACQWAGARRHDISMLPRIGFRDPEVRKLLTRMRSVLAFTGLAALQLFVTIIVANRVAGGLVAFQLALNFFYLPSAIIAWPIVRALVPRLSDFHQTGQVRAFRDELVHALALASFICIPISVVYAVGASPIAHLVAFGRLDTPTGVSYVTLSLLALSAAVIGETWFTLATYAFYAQENVTLPLRAQLIRVVATLALMATAFTTHGGRSLLYIGLATAGGTFAGAAYAMRHIFSGLPRDGYSLTGSIARTAIGSAIMVAWAVLTWLALDGLPESKLGDSVRFGVAAAVGTAAFVVAQARLQSSEVRLVYSGLARLARFGRGRSA
jgi:putative peptidoglycan lipid II flippase